MNKVVINNPKLRKFIRNTIGLPRYGEPFDTLVEEVFVREQHVLGLSKAEFIEDLRNFSFAIDKMSFVKTDEKWMGCAFPGTKEIQFNFDYWQNQMNTLPREKYCEEFFETVSHECLHGMQTRTDGYNRAGGYNNEIGNRSHAIYEIGTQGIAAKMSRSQTLKDLKENRVLTGDGYSDEIFAIGLLAATFGVSEQEVLKYSVRERRELIDVLDKNIGNKRTTASLVDYIETQLEYLHSINYPDKSQKQFSELSQKEKQQMSTTAMNNIVELVQFGFQERIKNISLDVSKDDSNQLKTDFKKAYDIFAQEKARFSFVFEPKANFAGKFVLGEKFNYIRNSIDVLDQITKSSNEYIRSNIPAYINSIRGENFNEIAQHGVYLRQDQSFLRIREESEDQLYERIYKDYNDFAEWDNYVINSAIYEGEKVERPNPKRIEIHSGIDRYSLEGTRKVEALRIALMSNKLKYSKKSKEVLYKFLQSDERGLDDVYSRITRTPIQGSNLSPRREFSANFRNDRDKAFLAEQIAERYVNKCFDREGAILPRENEDEHTVQVVFAQTMNKHDEKRMKAAICNILLNDDYSMVSGDKYSEQLAMLGNRRLFEILTQPLIEDMTNTRHIIPEKKAELRKMAVATEDKYPGTMNLRFRKMVEQYREGGLPDERLITGSVRKNFNYYFHSDRGVEDIVGMICDVYADKMELKNMMGAPFKNRYDSVFRNTIARYDKDYFRENMIRMVLHDDDSGFVTKDEAVTYRNLDLEEAIQFISLEYIKDAQFYEKNVMIKEKSHIKEFGLDKVKLERIMAGRKNFNAIRRTVSDLRAIKQGGRVQNGNLNRLAEEEMFNYSNEEEER